MELYIVGAGPAGISASLYAVRAGHRVTVLRQPGSALQKAEKIENYYGLETPISGDELLRRGWRQAEALGVTLVDEQAVGLRYEDKLNLQTTGHTYEADAVILATGSPRVTPKIPGLKDFEGKGVSYCATCDGFFCRGKAVAVLGSGDFALHEALELLPVAAAVTLLTQGGAAPAVPAGITVEPRKLTALTGDGKLEALTLEDGTVLDIPRLFVALGTAGSLDLARQLGAAVEGNTILVDETMQTTVPGVFAAGDCTGGWLQVNKAAHDGAVAGMSAVRYLRELGK